jgi:hypothetical protein
MFGFGKKKLPALKNGMAYRTVIVDGVKTKVAIPFTGYCYCEKASATATSPVHIRRVTDEGMFTGGGSGLVSLCGEKMAWDTSGIASFRDLEARIANAHDTNRTCTKCVTEASSVLGAI